MVYMLMQLSDRIGTLLMVLLSRLVLCCSHEGCLAKSSNNGAAWIFFFGCKIGRFQCYNQPSLVGSMGVQST